MNKAEAKRYVEGNITIIFMIISSSPSYIYLLQVLHSSRVFLPLNALYTNTSAVENICLLRVQYRQITKEERSKEEDRQEEADVNNVKKH